MSSWAPCCYHGNVCIKSFSCNSQRLRCNAVLRLDIAKMLSRSTACTESATHTITRAMAPFKPSSIALLQTLVQTTQMKMSSFCGTQHAIKKSNSFSKTRCLSFKLMAAQQTTNNCQRQRTNASAISLLVSIPCQVSLDLSSSKSKPPRAQTPPPSTQQLDKPRLLAPREHLPAIASTYIDCSEEHSSTNHASLSRQLLGPFLAQSWGTHRLH